MNYPRMHNYPVGSRVLRRDGNVHIKTEGGMVRLSRHVAAMSAQVMNGGRDLDEWDRVCHLDNTMRGEEGFDDPRNLVVIRVNREHVRFFKSKVLFIPTEKNQQKKEKKTA